jgi:hypothetical protein
MPLTHDAVCQVVSGLSDQAVARIIATNATREQLLEAFTWLREDDSLGRELHRRPSGVVGEVYDILLAEETELEEDEPG